MKSMTQVNVINVQTHELPPELTEETITGYSHGFSLFYTGGKFYYQTFFTPPTIGEMNRIEGLNNRGQVNIRSITKIGPITYHIRCSGDEKSIREMMTRENFYGLIRGMDRTLRKEDLSRRFIDLSSEFDQWNLLCSVSMKQTILLNYVEWNGRRMRLSNLITLNNKFLGISDEQKVYMGHLTPEIFTTPDRLLQVQPLDTVNTLGRIDLISQIPNTDTAFLVAVGNQIFEFTFWGDILHFQTLEENVSRINSITFNNTRGIVATNSGLYEMDVLEIPNMVKPYGLPKQIVNPLLKKEIEMALYVEDPEILGVHHAVGIIAKTEDNQVLFF